MFPIRCYTCNATIAHKHPDFERARLSGRTAKETLDEMGVTRMCCRRMFLSHVDLTRQQTQFGNVDVVLDQGGTTLRRYCKASRLVSTD